MTSENPAAKREWWDDPKLPWSGKPSRKELWCWSAIALVGVYGLVMIPLRPIILGLNTWALAAVTGSNIAMVDIGAKASLGETHWWPLGLLMAALTSIKFDWIWWWAGRLWGHNLIEVISGRSRWAARTGRYAEHLARRFGSLAMIACWFVPFLPSAIVYAFVGDVGMRLRKFLLLDFIAAVLYRGLWMYLGFLIGQPAKDFVDLLAKYSFYLSIVALVLVVGSVLWRNSRGGGGTQVLSEDAIASDIAVDEVRQGLREERDEQDEPGDRRTL